jgi:hypothetical protein
MTPRIPNNFSTWLVQWGLCDMPPRNPNDDDDDDTEDEDAEPDDDREPAVVREPDE